MLSRIVVSMIYQYHQRPG